MNTLKKKNRNIKPINEQMIKLSTGRNIAAGVTSCSASVQVQYLQDTLEKPVTSTPIAPSSGREKVFTWTSANVRSGPGYDYPIVTYARKGDRLIIIGEHGEWINVRLENGQEGWISSKFLE